MPRFLRLIPLLVLPALLLASRASAALDEKTKLYDPLVDPQHILLAIFDPGSSLAGYSREKSGFVKEDIYRAIAEIMLTPVPGSSYGLGFTITQVNGETYFGHGGANVGYRCIMTAHQTAGVGAVVMTNTDSGDEFLNDIVDLIGKSEGWPGY